MTTINTNTPSYKDLVEEDKRSVLEKVLEATFPESKTKGGTPANSSEKTGNTPGISDYDVLFGEDIDDIDELFEDIMKRAREDFKKHQELKKKYPHFDPLKDIFKKPAPKKPRKRTRTTKAVEKSLAIMNNFKKKMIEPREQVNTNNSTINTSSNNLSADYRQFRSSIKTLMQGNQYQETAHPIWKRTENYIPIFSATTNPNFANLHSNSNEIKATQLCTPMQCKLYTPGHISSWMNAATSSNPTEPPSCKSIRSDVAEHDSDSDENSMKSIENTSIYFSPEYKNIDNKNSSVNCKTPLKNTMNSSTRVLKNTMSSDIETLKNTMSSNVQIFKNASSISPLRNTTVRFRPSPPECFVYGSSGNSSISSDPIFTEQNENNIQIGSPEKYDEFYQDSEKNSPLCNSPLSLQTQYSPFKENIEYEEHHRILQTQYSPCKENIAYEEHHRIFSNRSVHDIQKNMSNVFIKKRAMFVEDFVRGLNYNISNNKVELKCSMKVKYY